MLGGVSGHAGLFSNSYEVALMLQTFLQGGVYNGIRLFDKESFDQFNYCYYCDKGNRVEQDLINLNWKENMVLLLEECQRKVLDIMVIQVL